MIISSFHFISAVHIWFILYIINNLFSHGNLWTHNWPAPNVSGFIITQLVEHRTGIARSRVQTPFKSRIFLAFFTQLHKLRSLRRSFLYFIFVNYRLDRTLRLHKNLDLKRRQRGPIFMKKKIIINNGTTFSTIFYINGLIKIVNRVL